MVKGTVLSKYLCVYCEMSHINYQTSVQMIVYLFLRLCLRIFYSKKILEKYKLNYKLFFFMFNFLQYYPNSGTRGRREGSGSTEATEMILNNLFYITVKVRITYEINDVKFFVFTLKKLLKTTFIHTNTHIHIRVI